MHKSVVPREDEDFIRPESCALSLADGEARRLGGISPSRRPELERPIAINICSLDMAFN